LSLTKSHVVGYVGKALEWMHTHFSSLFNIRECVCEVKRPRGRDMVTARKVKDHQGGYAGQYVALDPATGNKIVAHGTRSNCVAAEARRAGVEVPVIIYVPKRDSAYLY